MKLGIWGPILGPFLGPFRAQFGPNSGPFLGPQKIRSGTGPARKCPPGFFSGRPAGGRPDKNNNAPTLKAEKVFSRGPAPAKKVEPKIGASPV